MPRAIARKLLEHGELFGRVGEGIGGAFSAVGTAVLVAVFTFYFLPQFPAIVAGAGELIPRRYIGWVRETVLEIDRAMSAWIRGQITVMTILGAALRGSAQDHPA